MLGCLHTAALVGGYGKNAVDSEDPTDSRGGNISRTHGVRNIIQDIFGAKFPMLFMTQSTFAPFFIPKSRLSRIANLFCFTV